MRTISTSISEEFVKRSVIKHLTNAGWSKNLEFEGLRTPGVDIKVTNSKYGRTFFIETKGGPWYEVSFVYGLGQIVSRMRSLKARYYYGLALPQKSAQIALNRVPYQFCIGVCLHIFSVDHAGEVVWYKPRDIKRFQMAKAR